MNKLSDSKVRKHVAISLVTLITVASVWVGDAIWQPVDKFRVHLSSGPAPEYGVDDGFGYRDLNKNKKLDVYEDSRQVTALRVKDLLSQMTLAEKVGQMFHPAITIKSDFNIMAFHLAMGRLTDGRVEIYDQHISHFNFYGQPTPLEIAQKLNSLQKIAAKTRLGIPLTISSDPLHEVSSGGIAAFTVKGLSGWPSQLGFAAARDIELTRKFGEIAGAEYRALGLRMALHPMADLATEPRWPRNFGTFGADAALSSDLTTAYMRGFQGDSIGSESVLTMVKHFPGGGPQEFGLDPHLPSGKRQVYPGNNFDYHLRPFKKAIDNGLKVIMPYYGIPIDQTDDNVAMGFNKAILTDLLRNELGFMGVVCTDWGIVSSRPWGVEGLSIKARYKKSLDAGVDQYGGESEPEYILDLVREGTISEARIDLSVIRILTNTFDLGLFETALVDEFAIDSLINTESYIRAGLEAQRKSVVLLSNNTERQPALPLKRGIKVFVDGMDSTEVSKFAQIVASPDQADYIILSLKAVFNGTQVPGSTALVDRLLSSILADSNLQYNQQTLDKVEQYSKANNLITVVDLNRPAILSDINRRSEALIGTFGVYDSVLLEIIFGDFNPQGKLPFEIPSSMAAVLAQKEDLPNDSQAPTFVAGHGLSYPTDAPKSRDLLE